MTEEIKPKIIVDKNGPYIVSGGVPLKKRELKTDAATGAKTVAETDVPAAPVYLLCRCGRSKTKPFCDNSHITTGFDDSQ